MKKFTQAELDAFEQAKKSIQSLEKKYEGKKANQSDLQIIGWTKSADSNRKFREENPLTDEQKKTIGDAMRGKTLEEMIGEERAAEGRKSRSVRHKGVKRPAEVGQNIAASRRANGSYDGRSMLGKEHKESTKEIMAIKASIRQELKRKLGLGKSDKVPKDLLLEEYKKREL
jgi:hypothetical protein